MLLPKLGEASKVIESIWLAVPKEKPHHLSGVVPADYHASDSAYVGPESPAAIGLAPSGQLFWGEALLATDATSVTVRRSGAGGAFLLYTTRTHFLYTIPFRDLGRTLLGPAANVSNK